MIKNFRHACVIVKDLDRSLRFYRDLLGLKLVKLLSTEGKTPEVILGVKGIKLTYAKLRAPNQPKRSPAIFELHYWKSPKISPRGGYNHVSFSVKNLDREYARLRKAGVKFISKPVKAPYSGKKICFAYDPDKHLIEFAED